MVPRMMSIFMLLFLTSLAVARDPLQQPFATSSIWNMPIGSRARYVPANIPLVVGYKVSKFDGEHIVLSPASQLTGIYYNSAGWTGANRCTTSNELLTKVPLPPDYVVPNGPENDSTAALMPDGRSIVQFQPLARCAEGEPGTAYAVSPPVDLYGDGTIGAHGGSGLSAIGGAIRLGELRPGQRGPAHVLKVAVDAQRALFKPVTAADCFRWPATNGDGYCLSRYGQMNPGQTAAMKEGSLLAIPASVSIASLGLTTEPARELAWTLQNYGAYVVDDTYGDGFGFVGEEGPAGSFLAQFEKDYGFAFVHNDGDGSPFSEDMARIVGALNVVDNNSATSVGGGGRPLQPLAAELSTISMPKHASVSTPSLAPGTVTH